MFFFFFFFNDTATTEIYTLSLHDALPIFTVTSLTVKIHAGTVAGPRLLRIVVVARRAPVMVRAQLAVPQLATGGAAGLCSAAYASSADTTGTLIAVPSANLTWPGSGVPAGSGPARRYHPLPIAALTSPARSMFEASLRSDISHSNCV